MVKKYKMLCSQSIKLVVTFFVNFEEHTTWFIVVHTQLFSVKPTCIVITQVTAGMQTQFVLVLALKAY